MIARHLTSIVIIPVRESVDMLSRNSLFVLGLRARKITRLGPVVSGGKGLHAVDPNQY